jgi:hypothetical protein
MKAHIISPMPGGIWQIQETDLPDNVGRRVEAMHEIIGGYFEYHEVMIGRSRLHIHVHDEAAIRGVTDGFMLADSPPLLGTAVITCVTGRPVTRKALARHLKVFDLAPGYDKLERNDDNA